MADEPTIRVQALIHALALGGAEVMLEEFAKAAPRHGIELSVTYFRDQAGSPLLPRLQAAGVEPALVPISGMLKPGDHVRLRRHLRATRPDIIHTHIATADFFGGIAARTLGVPNVVTLHSTNWSYPVLRERVQMALMAVTRRVCAARTIAVSEGARSEYLRAGGGPPDRVVTIHNGVEGTPRPGGGIVLREELGIAADETVVMMLSALRPEKGHAVAIEAHRRLTERIGRVRLVIVGDGPARADVEELARAAGPSVVLAGYREDPMAVLDAADILLHPSVHEAFPTTLLEAMAASVPIVASAVGGVPEIVDDDVSGALLSSPVSAEAIADRLEQLIGDEALRARYAAEGSRRAAEEFGLDRWVRRTRGVYEELLRGEVDGPVVC